MATAEARFVYVEQRAVLYRTTVAKDAGALNDLRDMAMLCFDFADVVIQGCDIYRSVTQLDEDWRMLVLKKEIEFCPAFELRIENLYRDWLQTSLQAITIYEQFDGEYQRRGFDAAGVETLRRYCREAAGILTKDAEFFSHEKLFELGRSALEQHRRQETLEMNG